MKSLNANAVRRRFDERLRAVAPYFKRLKNIPLPPGTRVYEWVPEGQATFYIELSIDDLFNRFYVWIVCSRMGTFPMSRGPCGRDVEKDGIVCFHLEELWLGRPKIREWHVTTFFGDISEADQRRCSDGSPESKAMLKVIPAVDDAIAKIVQYAIPYCRCKLEEYADQAGQENVTGQESGTGPFS